MSYGTPFTGESSARSRFQAWREQRSLAARLAWRATDALRRGLVLGLAMVVAGVLLHRLTPVLLGAPLLISAVLALARPTRGSARVRVRPLPRAVETGTRTRVLVEVEPGEGAELLAIRLPAPDQRGIDLGPVYLVPASARVLATRLRWDAWGEHADLRPDHLVAGPDALFVFGPVVGELGSRVVLPPVTPLVPGALPPRSTGLVGAHRSRRAGDGIELRDVRAYQPGDRLRGVDWRATLRAGARAEGAADVLNTMFVRERHAEADAEILLALDTRFDVGAELGEWARAPEGYFVRADGSLDTAVRAVTSIAAAYLRQGDRVGYADLGRPQLSLPVGTGRRQLLRLRHQLVASARSAGWAPRPALHAEQVAAGALVVVVSPFLDDAIVRQTLLASRRGNRVLALDVLPGPLVADPETSWGPVVARIMSQEHRTRLAALRGQGVATVTWGDGTEVAVLLRQLARPGRRVGAHR